MPLNNYENHTIAVKIPQDSLVSFGVTHVLGHNVKMPAVKHEINLILSSRVQIHNRLPDVKCDMK